MNDVALPLDFQLYLEGVPVDFESISISSRIGSPSVANITIPPTVLSQKILPRTSVHVFYMDPNEDYDTSADSAVAGTPVFKLLFEGEVMSLSYRKTDGQRSTVLMCSDITNNFDYAYRYIIEDVDALISSPLGEFVAGAKPSVGVTNTGNTSLGSPIARLVSGSESIVQGVERLIRGTFVTGSEPGINTNEFLESVESRYRISTRVTSIADSDVVRLAQVRNFLEIIRRSTGRTPPNINLTSLINMYLAYVYYNRVSMLSPAYTNGVINTLVLLPNIYFSPPPKCNVLFPEHITNLGYTDHFLRTPTRLFLQTAPTGKIDQTGATQRASTYIAPREISNLLPTGGAGASKQPNNAHRILTSEEKIKGVIPVFKQVGQPEYAVVFNQRRETEEEVTGRELDSARNYLLNMAEYELEVRRAQTRELDQSNGPFNPEPVVGAPVAILDDVVFIFGMLEGLQHMITAGSGATTAYSIALSRRVSTKFDDLDLRTDEERDAVNQIGLLLDQDNSASQSQREENDLSGLQIHLDTLVEFNSDERLIDVVRRIIGSAVNERNELFQQYIDLLDQGVFEEIPENPRWVNSAFNRQNASGSYDTLYGCGSIMDPPSDIFEGDARSISIAANRLYDTYLAQEDKYTFVRRYTKRSNITNQLDFNEFYTLSTLASRDKAYPATGPFTTKRRNPIVDYVNDLRLNRAHPG